MGEHGGVIKFLSPILINLVIIRASKAGGVGGGELKNFFKHHNELLIWVYPENLVKIGLLVEALNEFCGTA